MKKRRPIEKFINDQLSRWPLACDNFRALKDVQTRQMTIGGLEVKVQFNPSRVISTAADVSDAAVRTRKCFLCKDNRPEEQIHLKFEGRKAKRYEVLVNPYPIFTGHLVIASDRHSDQCIWKRYVDMLDMTRAFGGYTVFYNGPHCGASAPDHFHFQAAQRGRMPLECDADRMLDAVRDTQGQDIRPGGECALEYLTSVQDAELFHYRKFARGIFVLRASTVKSAAKLFYRLLDCAPVSEAGREPMFNLLSWYAAGEFRSVVIFRGAHRPHHYFSSGEDHLMISPGCADMAGVVITPVREDFMKITPALLSAVYDEVCMSEQAQHTLLWRLTRKQPVLSVGIMSAVQIEFEILSDGAGPRFATYTDGKIEYDGALYDELYFDAQTPSHMFAEPAFVLYGVTIGVDFHWERKENQKFAGALKIMVGNGCLTAVNIIGVEDYLLSVISSEMKSTASEEFLKAHAVISRSWVMARTGKEVRSGSSVHVSDVPAPEPGVLTHVRWYGRDDHDGFDVCADDHCQRYQGLTRAVGDKVRRVVDETWGQVLSYDGKVCDARFSKCCGGVTERFSACWEDTDYPYLRSVADTPSACAGAGLFPERGEDAGDAGNAFCDTADEAVLSQVLNDYDLETKDFYEWTAEYDREDLSGLISRKLGSDIGTLLALVPVKRGDSGRIYLMDIIGTECTVRTGKELEIRKLLSETHLKSSAFEVVYYDRAGSEVPAETVIKAAVGNSKEGPAAGMSFDRVVLKGRGWGHGVGLCQIGAAVMAEKGYGYREILKHYYPGAEITDMPEREKGI